MSDIPEQVEPTELDLLLIAEEAARQTDISLDDQLAELHAQYELELAELRMMRRELPSYVEQDTLRFFSAVSAIDMPENQGAFEYCQALTQLNPAPARVVAEKEDHDA